MAKVRGGKQTGTTSIGARTMHDLLSLPKSEEDRKIVSLPPASAGFAVWFWMAANLALPRGERQTNPIKSLAESLGKSCGIEFQGISAGRPKPKFEPLEHSVNVGRRFLGRHKRIGKSKFAAFDADDRLLGRFNRLANAQNAFNRLAAEDER